MDTKLTDFTTAELQVLLDTVLIREIHLASNIQERENIYAKAGAMYPYHVREVKQEHDELQTLRQWHTQILNAIGKVGIQEQINNN